MPRYIRLNLLSEGPKNNWHERGEPLHFYGPEMEDIKKVLNDNGINYYSLYDVDSLLRPFHSWHISKLDELIETIEKYYPWVVMTKKEKIMLTSQINNKEKIKEPKPFPKIMKYNNGEFVILASIQQGDHISGTVIKTDDPDYKLGDVDTFSPKAFQDWEGSITLTQD